MANKYFTLEGISAEDPQKQLPVIRSKRGRNIFGKGSRVKVSGAKPINYAAMRGKNGGRRDPKFNDPEKQ